MIAYGRRPPVGSVVFDVRDVVFRRAARVRVDPVGDAELGLGFLQRFARLDAGPLACMSASASARVGNGPRSSSASFDSQ